MRRRRRRHHSEGHNVWRAYSDMMAGLLLLFVLVMCISFMEAQKNYREKLSEQAAHQQTQTQLQKELSERESEINAQQAALDEQSALLVSQQAALDEQSALLASQQAALDEQSALVASQQADLDEKSALLAEQQTELEEQKALVASSQSDLQEKETLIASQKKELDEKNTQMAAQQAALDEQESLLADQQQKIEQIIGVKADLIADLKSQFDEHNLNVVIDEASGAIALDSNVLFAYNESELTEEGIAMLGEILPVYCKVLMDPQYEDYLAELSIDGYTDTSGDYIYNLELSQARALAVASYLFQDADSFLTDDELTSLKEKLTSNGHSMSNPVYSDGEINMDASRRVEVRFRLKDEEMINELKDVLAETTTAQSETSSEAQTEG